MALFTFWAMFKPLFSKSAFGYAFTTTLMVLLSVLAISGCTTIKQFAHVRPTGSIAMQGDTIKAGFGLDAAQDSTAAFVTAFSGYLLLYPQADSLYCGELLLRDTTRHFEWKMRLGCVNYEQAFRWFLPKDTSVTPTVADPNRSFFKLPVTQPTSAPLSTPVTGEP